MTEGEFRRLLHLWRAPAGQRRILEGRQISNLPLPPRLGHRTDMAAAVHGVSPGRRALAYRAERQNQTEAGIPVGVIAAAGWADSSARPSGRVV